MRFVWVTDIHLNFCTPAERAALAASITATQARALFITGDISEAPPLELHLRELTSLCGLPTYFVLGNHDYYRSNVAAVRASVRDLPCIYMHGAAPVLLDADTALVGCDGWGDARLGDPINSRVFLNDFIQIADLARLRGTPLFTRLSELGDESARALDAPLQAALAARDHVIVLTHVPPFAEACWHEGQISDTHWLPFFTCKAVGDVLLEAAGAHPQKRITVLCGHTHSAGVAQLAPNLTVHTGAAKYGKPELQPDAEAV